MFKVLTVAENGYESDSIAIQYQAWRSNDITMKITYDRKLFITSGTNCINAENFTRKDIDELIECLQFAKTCLNEEVLARTLMGKSTYGY